LKPDTESTGSINLSINVCDSVKKLIIKSDNSDWPDELKEISFIANSSYTLKSNGVKSGIYSTTFYYYDANNILLYSTEQSINVFGNMTTDTWVSDGSRLINESGAFNLTEDLINQFARTTFYVGSTGVGTASDETGSGSVYSPLVSVTKAASIIAAAGDSSKDYRIYVCGEVTGAQEISEAINGKANSLIIEGLNGLDENGMPEDELNGAFSWVSQGTVLTISSCTVPVTIKNLKITGGCNSASGGGICISGKSNNAAEMANLTLDSGTLITENYIKPFSSGGYVIKTYGAGIYMYYGRLTMKSGAVITGNKTIQYSESSSQVYSSGAGIGLNTGTEFIMKGGEITENIACGSGGAICMETNNYANDISVTLTGGRIENNQCEQGNGGSIADFNGASLTIGGSVYIPCKGTEKLNDIYLAVNKTLILADTLTKHDASNHIVITPAWKRGAAVVQADGTNVTDLTSYIEYFAFTRTGWECKLSTNKKSLILDAPIYVAGTGRSVCTRDGDDEEGNGTKSKPFKTIKKAIEVMDDNTADYIIYIDGIIEGYNIILNTLTTESSGKYRAQSITIEGVNGLDEKGEPKDVLDANKQQNTTLTVNSNVPVTIKNLKLTGSRGIGNGGGINIGESATLFLGDGVLVTDNSASYGGGVYNAGKLFMYGSAMVGKTTNSVAKNDSYGNMTTGRGGGICLVKGSSLYLGYKSETEEFELTGGVCGNYNNNSMYNYGGGIYNYGALNFKIASGNISYNCATYGAGIYTEGDVIMTGGVIEGNEAKGYGNGGGVYVTTKSSFSMSGSAKIQNNKNVEKGAGLFLKENSSLIMTGGTISGNKAENGGAVFMACNNETEYSHIEIGVEATIPYGVQNEQNEFVKEAGMNDIYMEDNVTIKITSSLSGCGEGNVIGLTPNSYTNGRPLLEAGTGVTLADEVGKFTIPNNDWEINSFGKLITLSYTPSSVSDLVTYLQELPDKKNVTITINQNETIDTSSMSSGQSCITIPEGKYVTLQSDESKTLKFLSSNSAQLSNTTDFYFITVKSGAKLTIGNGITIKGADYDNAHTVALYIERGAEVILDGAVITGFVGNGDGTVYIVGGTFTMNEGSITSCKARYGSAVYLLSNGTFNFNGGSISNCSNVNGKTVDGSGTMNWKTSSATFSQESIGNNVTVNRQ
jgi:hypothetical protein